MLAKVWTESEKVTDVFCSEMPEVRVTVSAVAPRPNSFEDARIKAEECSVKISVARIL